METATRAREIDVRGDAIERIMGQLEHDTLPGMAASLHHLTEEETNRAVVAMLDELMERIEDLQARVAAGGDAAPGQTHYPDTPDGARQLLSDFSDLVGIAPARAEPDSYVSGCWRFTARDGSWVAVVYTSDHDLGPDFEIADR